MTNLWHSDALVLHFLHPVSLTLGVFAFDLTSLLLGHGMVASHALLGLFGLEGLVLPIGSHTSHAFVVASTVHGLHVLDPIQGRVLALPIPFLLLFVFLRVPFFLGGLAQSWRIHDPALTIGQHTHLPMPATFGMDWESVFSGHDGPAAAARFDHGDDGNSRGSEHALATNGQLGNDYRPSGSTLGLSQSLQGSGAVWAVWGV